MLKVIAAYVFLFIAAVIFYISFIDRLSLILLLTVLSFPIALVLSLILIRAKTDIGFVCEKSGENKGNAVYFKIYMHNKTFLPLPRVKISVSYKNLLCGEKTQAEFLVPLHFSRTQTLRFSITSNYCGKVEASIDEILFYDYLNMFRLKKAQKLKSSCIFLPSICDADIVISESSEFAGEKEVYSKTQPGDDASEIFDMREYALGDRMSQIHWKLSSKQGELIVKEYSKPVNCNVMLLTDFNSDNAKSVDLLADFLISLSHSMIEHENEHFVSIYSSHQDSLKQFDIDSVESCVMMARNVMTTPAFKEPKALASYCDNEITRRYSHVIYACAEISEIALELLKDISVYTRVSVVVTSDCENSFSDGISDTFPIYYAGKGKIETLLSELMI